MIEIFLTIFILFLFSGFIIVYVLNLKPMNNKKVKDLYAEGLDLMITGRRKAAYKNFKEIISKDSDNIKAYLKLGQVLREGGNPLQALKIHKGLNHRRSNSHYEKIEIHKNLALDYYKLDNIDSAVLELNKLLKLERNNEWALSQLVIFYRYKQDWKNAGELLEKYQKLTNKQDNHKLALYKIQEGRSLIEQKQFSDARQKFEQALNISSELAVAYYFIGKSYSSESENAYQKSLTKEVHNETDSMQQAEDLLAKAIPMWIRYTELNPKQSWMVIHLLKDSLFALNRYSEFEDILKHILRQDPNNIEVIASLSEIYSHRGENEEALDFIDKALEKDSTSLIVKLIKMKLESKKEKGSINFTRNLDDLIHFLVTDERFQIYKNTNTDSDIVWLYEATIEK